MMGENHSVSYGGGVSCTKVSARCVVAACDCVVSSSLRSSLDLTCLPDDLHGCWVGAWALKEPAIAA